MAVFVLIAVVMALLALGLATWPLWRQSRGMAVGALFALGLATFALYRMIGNPAAVDPAARVAATAPAGNAAPGTPATLEEAIVDLQNALKRDPAQPEGWRLLGKSLAALQRFDESREAFAKALQLLPDDPDLLVESAQSRLYSNPERKLDAQAIAYLQRALELQPAHQRGLWFLGMAQRQDGKSADAAKTWETLLPLVEPATAATLRQQIDEARGDAGLAPLPAAEPAQAAVADTALLRVVVDLAPALKAKLGADDSVFVFARQADGPPMPVAAKRVPAHDFPITVALGDDDSPMPTLKLSESFPVQLAARISKSGQANRSPGDLESRPLPIEATPDPKAVHTLLIDQVVE